MKTIKRSFSTALIACLLLSLLVPTALAATTIAQKVIEYSFKDYLPVVFETDSNIALGQKSDNGSVPNDNYNTAMETYADNNINSACMYWSSEYVSGSGNPAVPTAIDKGISLAAYVGDWLAIKIKSPGAGEFKVGVRPFSDSSAPKGCNVYVLPIEKENPITAEQLSAVLENTTAVGNITLTSTSKKQTAGSFVFEEGYDDYLVVFRSTLGKSGGTGSTERADYKLEGIQLIKSCTDSADAAKEISNAPLGSTITLQAACDAGNENVVVSNGVTLNLNGKNLTANSVTILNGGSVIDSGETAGLVTANLSASGSNGGYLPLKDNTGYRFYQAAMEAKENGTPSQTGNVKVRFKVSFTNAAAYSLIAEGNTGLTINGKFGGDSTAEGPFRRAEDATAEAFAKAWAEQAAAKNGGVLIFMEFSGLEQGTNLTLTPSVTCAGVTISGTEQTVQ